MKQLGALLVVVLALAFALPAGIQAAENPVVVQQQIIDAVNRGDITGAAKYLSDDAVITGGFTCAPAACSTKAAVQRELDMWKSQQVQITRIRASSFVGELSAWEEHRATLVKAAGVDRVIVEVTAKFKDGKFVSYNIKPDTRDAQTAKFIEYISRQSVTGATTSTTAVTVTTAPVPSAAATAAQPAAATAARPPVAPVRLPSTGTGDSITTATNANWMALGILVSTLFVSGLALARRKH
jgi:hypothetical protein